MDTQAVYLALTFWLCPNLDLPVVAAYPVSAVGPAAVLYAIKMGYVR